MLAMAEPWRACPSCPIWLWSTATSRRTCPARSSAWWGGDGISLSIAAASIVAKVVRDRLMQRLDRRYPGYFWASNAGYATQSPPRCAASARPDVSPSRRLRPGRGMAASRLT